MNGKMKDILYWTFMAAALAFVVYRMATGCS
jgi:hypothetical protein